MSKLTTAHRSKTVIARAPARWNRFCSAAAACVCVVGVTSAQPGGMGSTPAGICEADIVPVDPVALAPTQAVLSQLGISEDVCLHVLVVQMLDETTGLVFARNMATGTTSAPCLLLIENESSLDGYGEKLASETADSAASVRLLAGSIVCGLSTLHIVGLRLDASVACVSSPNQHVSVLVPGGVFNDLSIAADRCLAVATVMNAEIGGTGTNEPHWICPEKDGFPRPDCADVALISGNDPCAVGLCVYENCIYDSNCLYRNAITRAAVSGYVGLGVAGVGMALIACGVTAPVGIILIGVTFVGAEANCITTVVTANDEALVRQAACLRDLVLACH